VTFYTIGFTKKPASKFFRLLKESRAKRIVDVRLNNSSQLAGFAKRDDLAYFLESVCDMEYVHLPILAPTKEMLDEYRKGDGDWDRYAQRFLNLMRERRVETEVPREIIEDGCLLCSEAEPHHCHRRLVGEYLQERWGDMEMWHLE
jgi:uncharacterized protein (DUF488 family)